MTSQPRAQPVSELAAASAINCNQFLGPANGTRLPITRYALAKVTAARVAFEALPGIASPNARPAARGSQLIVTDPPVDGRVVAFNPSDKLGASGCMPSSDLQPVPPAKSSTSPVWRGHWTKLPAGRYQRDFIDLKQAGDTLAAEGTSLWFYSPDGSNEGDLKGQGKPVGGVLEIQNLAYQFTPDHFDCTVRMQRIGPYLVVDDRNVAMTYCGGQNTSFTGVYVRKTL